MNDELRATIESLPADLESASGDIAKLDVLIGLDGFVDNLTHVVDTRTDSETYSHITSIGDFGKRVLSASGLSTNMELVTYQTKPGGNGPNMAAALLEYGTRLSYFGAIGQPGRIDPVFRGMADRCANVYAFAPPARTDALEFFDGKVMLGKMSVLSDVTWENVRDGFGGAPEMAGAVARAGLLGIENWTMLPHMSRIWQGMIDEVFPLLPNKPPAERPFAFFDLCDPVKRSTADIAHALGLITRFSDKFRVILGLNHKEMFEIAPALGINAGGYTADPATDKELSRTIYEKLGIHTLVVHPVREAFAWSGGEFSHVTGPYCEKPVLTTGAGDNFNAGFALCAALNLCTHKALALGVATSGFYVRNGRSPSLGEVCAFLRDWKNGKL